MIGIISKTKLPIGLDISDSSIRLVQLEKRGGSLHINGLGRAALPEDLVKNGEISDPSALAAEIGKLIKSPQYGRLDSDQIIMGVPEQKSFLKLMKVEHSGDPQELIRGEIERNIPLRIDELYYDWQIMESATDHDLVMIGASPKSVIDQYVALSSSAGLNLVAIEIEPISIARSLLKEEAPSGAGDCASNYGIIDFGSKRTSMFVYSKNAVLFTVDIPISGKQVTDTIAEKLDISKEQAEKAKTICGLDDDKAQGVVKRILTQHVKDLTEKIKSVITFYNDYYSDRGPINKILLCGGGANIKNLDAILRQETLIETMVGNSMSHITIDHGAFLNSLSSALFTNNPGDAGHTLSNSIIQSLQTTFAVATGLSLRGAFNPS